MTMLSSRILISSTISVRSSTWISLRACRERCWCAQVLDRLPMLSLFDHWPLVAPTPAAQWLLLVFIALLVLIKEFVFRIFDRWGEMVFQTNSILDTWDGKYNGMELNTAVFVYSIKVKYKDGREEVQQGNITLVKWEIYFSYYIFWCVVYCIVKISIFRNFTIHL